MLVHQCQRKRVVSENRCNLCKSVQSSQMQTQYRHFMLLYMQWCICTLICIFYPLYAGKHMYFAYWFLLLFSLWSNTYSLPLRFFWRFSEVTHNSLSFDFADLGISLRFAFWHLPFLMENLGLRWRQNVLLFGRYLKSPM